MGFGSYLANLLGLSSSYQIFLAIMLIILLAVLNMMGIKKAVNADFALVIIKIAALLAFVAFALYFAFGIAHFNPSNFGVDPAQ